MDINTRLGMLEKHARQHCPAPSDQMPGYTLIFSVSDGAMRATVRHVSAKSFDEAFKLGTHRIKECLRREKISAKHLRLDWVESSTPTSWGEFQKKLDEVKRTYFRFGLAFDKNLTHLLTEMECHANAIFYGGADIFTGRFNAGNFAKYAKGRFTATVIPPQKPEAPVWLVSTAGVYCGEDNVVHHLSGLLPESYGTLNRGLYTGHREIPKLTEDFLHQAITTSSHWLAKQILPDGRFIYGYFPCFDRPIPSYNSLRHASSLYSLLDVADFIKDTSLIEPVERSLDFLAQELIREYEPEQGRRMAFLVDENAGEIKLGANGAALLAYAKHQELTGSNKYNTLMEHLAEGIAFLQNQETGIFTHVLHSENLEIKNPFRIIYYDGEAVFGLLRLYAQNKNPRWLAIARKAFEHFLISEKHAKAHDHWLSYAANEICLHLPDERYFVFGVNNCLQYLDFMLQRETTYPTLLELLMATQKLLLRAKSLQLEHIVRMMDMDKFLRALHYRAHYLLNGFFWPEMAMFFKNPNRIVGSFFIRHHAFRTRIDDAQHYLSGLAAYGNMLRAGESMWAAPDNPHLLGTRFIPASK